MRIQVKKKGKVVEMRLLRRNESPEDFMDYVEERHGKSARCRVIEASPRENNAWRVAEIIRTTASEVRKGKQIFVNGLKYQWPAALQILFEDPTKTIQANRDGHGRLHITLLPVRKPPRRSPRRAKK